MRFLRVRDTLWRPRPPRSVLSERIILIISRRFNLIKENEELGKEEEEEEKEKRRKRVSRVSELLLVTANTTSWEAGKRRLE